MLGMNKNTANILFRGGRFYLTGDWTKHNLPAVQHKIRKIKVSGRKTTLDLSKLGEIDTAGAMLIRDLIQHLKKHWLAVEVEGLSPEHEALLDLIKSKEKKLSHLPPPPVQAGTIEVVGRETMKKVWQLESYVSFLGQFTIMFFHTLTHFSPLQWRSFIKSIDEMGYGALPIIALLSFLVGVVLAYQLGVQLQNYGADAFIVNLIGEAVLREFGPLLTAIISAGRTSSAITAQLGTMKINEEIDALQTMGFSPFDILVIPKVLAALIAIPLLIVWADIFGVLGGMIMTKNFFGINYGDFLNRFRVVIDTETFFVGMSKAPVFALIISMVGCFQGMRVTSSADSVGLQTTKSVVQSIFLIIIADAIFSIIYSKLRI